jgi:2-alkenal reductase
MMNSGVSEDRDRKAKYSRFLVYVLIAIFGGIVGGSVVFLFSGILNDSESTPPVPTSLPTQDVVLEVEQLSFDISTAVTDAVDKVAPSVVTVVNHLPPRRTFFGNLIEQSGSGSGAIISEDGYIITNFHVVQEAERLEVIFVDGTIHPAELIGIDPYGDLAIIQVFSEINTVTVGVVSATGRSIETDRRFELEGLIQTDAAINQGNSGGPLVNLAGQIVGINTLIVRGNGDGSAIAEGLGFAVPSNVSRAVADSLILEGSIARPYLGANWGVITPDVAERFGLPVDYGIYLSEIAPESPAAEAGLLRGDILIAIDEQSIDPDHPFINKLFQYSPGDEITFTVVREEEQFDLIVQLGKR